MTHQKIAIFGQYKTGTTGLFTKIQNSLPTGTRTLFEPLFYNPETSDENNCVLAKVIIKEPGHPEPVDYASFLGFDRRLCLFRDPRDWLVSATLFMCQLKSSIYANSKATAWVMEYLRDKEENPRAYPLKLLLDYLLSASPAIGIDVFAHRAALRHAYCIEFQKTLEPNVCLVRYEDFVDGQLHEVEAYLGVQLHGNAQVEAIYGHVPRTCSHGNWRDWFTEEDVEFFKPFFSDYIQHYDYDKEWSLNSEPTISPAHCSHYVSRIMKMKSSATSE